MQRRHLPVSPAQLNSNLISIVIGHFDHVSLSLPVLVQLTLVSHAQLIALHKAHLVERWKATENLEHAHKKWRQNNANNFL